MVTLVRRRERTLRVWKSTTGWRNGGPVPYHVDPHTSSLSLCAKPSNPDAYAMAAKPPQRHGGLLDLERHFAFYGAYHSDAVNVAIHALFVWPIFFTTLLLLHLAAPPPLAAAFAALYAAFYLLLDRRAGALAALLCLLCWAGSGSLAARLGFSTGWKVVLAAQLFCWTMQFIGHGVFEKRAPALLDNLVQAFLMAPFFVLLEILQKFVGYEPYPGFRAKVNKLIDADRKEWQAKKAKKMS